MTRRADVEAIQVRNDLAVVSRILRIRRIVIAVLVMTVHVPRRTRSLRVFSSRKFFVRARPEWDVPRPKVILAFYGRQGCSIS